MGITFREGEIDNYSFPLFAEPGERADAGQRLPREEGLKGQRERPPLRWGDVVTNAGLQPGGKLRERSVDQSLGWRGALSQMREGRLAVRRHFRRDASAEDSLVDARHVLK